MNTKLNYKFATFSLTVVEVLACLLLSGIVSANPTNTQLNTEASEEIELSPEGREILCKRFPLNSRCQGSAEGATPIDTSGSGTTETETTPPTDTPPAGDNTPDPNNPGPDTTTPSILPGRPTTLPRTP